MFEVVESGVSIMISFSSLSYFAICFSVTSCNDVLEFIQTRNELDLYCDLTRLNNVKQA